MPLESVYSGEQIDITADKDKGFVQIELSSSGYRPKYVSVFVEKESELDEIIAALEKAKVYLKEEKQEG